MNIWIALILLIVAVVIVALIWFYIHDKKKTAREKEEFSLLKKEREHYPEVIMTFSGDYRITYANQTAKEIFSLDDRYQFKRSAIGVSIKVGKESPEEFFTYIKSITIDKSVKLYNAMIVINGKRKKVNLFLDKSHFKRKTIISCVIDINPVQQQETETKNINLQNGSVDTLTGLSSQFAAISDINQLILQSQKASEPFSLFLLGIDNFDDLQTALGLSYTNQILKSLAQFFKKNKDKKIISYRMDADKFLFVVKYPNENDSLHSKARELLVSIGNIYKDHNDFNLTNSIGIVQYPQDGNNAIQLIDNVYIALHKAQQQGESNIKLFTQEYKSVHIDEVKMNEEIQKGLKNKEFLLYYQPIFDLKGERIIGAESLLRWKHPEHGLLPADKFLDVAEKTGLVVDLGEYVFDEAIKQRQHFNKGSQKNFKITINLSIKEMQVDKLIPKLEVLFKKYNVPRDAINLDFSERSVMNNIDKTAHDFKLLKMFGLSISIDNFGAGCSSFKHLSTFPLSMLKVDRSLIFDLALNLDHQTTVRAIIDFAHALGYQVVAEGVETSKEAAILKTLNCDYAQGYLYSRPLPATEFEELLDL
jgi:diguanylate cyclase (GGDEF)-like protein